MADRCQSLRRKDSLRQRAFGHGHVHRRVAFHLSRDAFVGLFRRFLDQSAFEKNSEEQSHQHNHQWPAHKFRKRELPPHQHDDDDR